jgi:hypothetical protein
MWAIKSFAAAAGLVPHLVIHDDGTIEPSQVKLLQGHFPDAMILTEANVNQQSGFLQFMAAFPHLSYLRRIVDFCLARKLVDPLYFRQRQYLIFVDSDVLFFRRPSLLLELAEQRRPFASTDCIDAYCPSSDELERVLGIRPIPRVNAGLWGCSADVINLAFLEDVLRKLASAPELPNFNWCHFWLEQTLVGLLLGQQDGVAMLPGDMYGVGFQRISSTTCSHHFTTGSARKLYYRLGLRSLHLQGSMAELGRLNS